ncbi:uncharacterized protein [Neodiprion pinetum]|uniref:uncharacterized protein isoform X6 n=1 Tax=Neodiprion pinetum TaxID=441929 RepID=UPI0037107B1F
MPKPKQPSSLKSISFEAMVAHFVDRCDRLSIDGVSRRLRRQISLIKHHLHPRLLSNLFAEFCSVFLEEFYRVGINRSELRPDGHNRAVLEVMMDLEIPGLKCGGDILRFLDLRDSHRFRGLRKLDLDGFWDHGPRTLAKFRLQDLAELCYPRNCTDLDLEVVGQRCPKLQVLDVAGSVKVTDRGLRALSSCPDLRVLDLYCCRVTDDGVNELLSTHRKIEEFNAK